MNLLESAIGDLRSAWKQLVVTDIVYKVLAFVLLLPLVGILFRCLVALSGKSLLADQDILFFFLGPVGWVCFVAVGAIWLGIVALEQATLLGILASAEAERRIGVVTALRFALATARPVILVTARLLAYVLLTILPFLAVIGGIYMVLLGAHDINFYLKEKPLEFWWAVGLAICAVVAMVAVLLRLITSWFFALPLVLLEDVSGSQALRVSKERVTGHGRTVLFWIVAWGLASFVLSAVGTWGVVSIGQFLAPRAVGSLWLLATAIGGTLLLWAVVSLAVNLLCTVAFATLLFRLYRDQGQGRIDTAKLPEEDVVAQQAGVRVTVGRLVAAGVVGCLVATAVGIAAVRTVSMEDRATITAHRGAAASAPENTMASVKRAIEDGTDWVEIDVQETADDEVVVFHDSDFMRTAGKDLKIWDATMDDLKEIDVGSSFSPEFKDERVPTLAAVLDECKGKVGVNIELKYYGHDKQLEQRVIDIVEARGMASEIVIMSLKVDAVKKMKALRPDWKVGLLMSVSAGNLSELNLDFLAINASFANRRFVRAAHDLGREVYVWTVDDAPTMSIMAGRGVDSLITNKPALARRVMEERARLSPPERLLLELSGVLGLEAELGEQ